eukprot:186552-Prymnesium_polylepis.1
MPCWSAPRFASSERVLLPCLGRSASNRRTQHPSLYHPCSVLHPRSVSSWLCPSAEEHCPRPLQDHDRQLAGSLAASAPPGGASCAPAASSYSPSGMRATACGASGRKRKLRRRRKLWRRRWRLRLQHATAQLSVRFKCSDLLAVSMLTIW